MLATLMFASVFLMVTFVVDDLDDDGDEEDGSHQYPEKICIHNFLFYVMRQ